jgi:hypothetical protein
MDRIQRNEPLFTIAQPFALLLALPLSLDAAALSLRSEKRADGTTVAPLPLPTGGIPMDLGGFH